MMGGAFVEVDQQSIPMRIPLGISFEIDCDRTESGNLRRRVPGNGKH